MILLSSVSYFGQLCTELEHLKGDAEPQAD